jgi:IS5 family transposase
MLCTDDPLVVLRQAINWDALIKAIEPLYNSKIGRPSCDLRLMSGLLILQYLFNYTDEDIIYAWRQNPYYQYFTGSNLYLSKIPCNPSTLCNFRKRIKTVGAEAIFLESINLHGPEIFDNYTIIDSTCQVKYTSFPTDTKLILDVINKCFEYSAHFEFKFAKDYTDDVARIKKSINFAKGKGSEETKATKIQQLRDIANDLLDQVETNADVLEEQKEQFNQIMSRYRKAVNQKKDDKNKVYSIFEDVKCYAKGKTNVKYEFGSKVSIVISETDNTILGIKNFTSTPYDGDTIEPTLEHMYNLYGYYPENMAGDLGYRGRHRVLNTNIITPELLKTATGSERETIIDMLRRRTIIEPVIGHLKSDHRMGRNLLHGVEGDSLNAIMAAAAFNFKKFINKLGGFLYKVNIPPLLKKSIKAKRKTRAVPFWKPMPEPAFC